MNLTVYIIMTVPIINLPIFPPRQKRYGVFIKLLWVFTATLAVHVLVNCCSLVWGIPAMKLRCAREQQVVEQGSARINWLLVKN